MVTGRHGHRVRRRVTHWGGIGGYEYGVPLHVRLSLSPTAPARRVTLKRILDSEMGDLSCKDGNLRRCPLYL